MPSAYNIHRATNNDLFFILEDDNGKEILSSEMYMRLDTVMEGIKSVRENSVLDERYIRKTENSGKQYFVLVKANNEAIGTGELYSSNEALEKGIELVKRTGPNAPVIDESTKSKKQY